MSAREADLPVLWQLRFSHFNEKARWALDYKGFAHRRRSLAPGPHSFRSRRLGGSGTTPLLILDGQVLGDTTEIIAELERRQPEPSLYPQAEAERRRALELEEHFDTELGPGLRSAVFHALLPHRRTTVPMLTQGLGAQHRIASNALYPLIRRAVKHALKADNATAQRGREQTIAALDLIERELDGADYLVGEAFSVADLTATALLCPLVAPRQFAYEWPPEWPPEWEDFRRSLADRPAYRWVEEMFARHRGSSAAVSDD